MKILFHLPPLALLLGSITAAQDCYNTTKELAFAQANDPRSDSERGVYSLCPGLAITVGFPADPAFSSFASGDFPLTVLRPNTTIDGNGAAISGGMVQFATLAAYIFDGTLFAAPKQGTIIKNIVFDGAGMMAFDGFGAQSMFISAPGDYVASNITFRNTVHDSCGSRPVFVGQSSDPELAQFTPPGVINFTLEDSTFIDISVRNCTSLYYSDNQIITAKNLIYDSVTAFAAVSVAGPVGSVAIENVCISDSKFSYAPLANVETETMLISSLSGLYVADSVENAFCGSNLLYSYTDQNDTGTCSLVSTADSCFAPLSTDTPNMSATDAPQATDASTDESINATKPPNEASAAVSAVASATALFMASLGGFSLIVL